MAEGLQSRIGMAAMAARRSERSVRALRRSPTLGKKIFDSGTLSHGEGAEHLGLWMIVGSDGLLSRAVQRPLSARRLDRLGAAGIFAFFSPLRDRAAVCRAPGARSGARASGPVDCDPATANAAVSWLVSRGWECPIALVPAGTGNNLASGLGIPLASEAALEIALRGRRLRALDAFAYRAGDDPSVRYIVQTSALAYPAEMAGWYDSLRRRAVLRALLRPLGSGVYRLVGICGLVREKLRER